MCTDLGFVVLVFEFASKVLKLIREELIGLYSELEKVTISHTTSKHHPKPFV